MKKNNIIFLIGFSLLFALVTVTVNLLDMPYRLIFEEFMNFVKMFSTIYMIYYAVKYFKSSVYLNLSAIMSGIVFLVICWQHSINTFLSPNITDLISDTKYNLIGSILCLIIAGWIYKYSIKDRHGRIN